MRKALSSESICLSMKEGNTAAEAPVAIVYPVPTPNLFRPENAKSYWVDVWKEAPSSQVH